MVTRAEFAKFSMLGNRLIIWRSLVQAQDGPQKRIVFNGSLFCYSLFALTTPPYRIPQGVTIPRHLRLTAVGVVEAEPFVSAFTIVKLKLQSSQATLTRVAPLEEGELHKVRGRVS